MRIFIFFILHIHKLLDNKVKNVLTFKFDRINLTYIFKGYYTYHFKSVQTFAICQMFIR